MERCLFICPPTALRPISWTPSSDSGCLHDASQRASTNHQPRGLVTVAGLRANRRTRRCESGRHAAEDDCQPETVPTDRQSASPPESGGRRDALPERQIPVHPGFFGRPPGRDQHPLRGVEAGDRVLVAGYPAMDDYGYALRESVVQLVEHGRPVTPQSLPLEFGLNPPCIICGCRPMRD